MNRSSWQVVKENRKKSTIGIIGILIAMLALVFSKVRIERTTITAGIELTRKLILKDLEVYEVFRHQRGLAYVIIEDTKGTYTAAHRQLDPLCFMAEEDIEETKNVLQIHIISDQPLEKADSDALKEFFSMFVDRAVQTNHVTQEIVDERLYDDIDTSQPIEKYQRMLKMVGSNYTISPIDSDKWLYLSQDE